MGNYILERSQIINRSQSETFAFFCDAFNLEQITPGFLQFRVLTPPPISMQEGRQIEYRLSLFGISFRWKTLIEAWQPDECFVDRQISGPYALWRHTHTFEPLGPHRTLMKDRVEYRLPLGPAGRLAHVLWVRRTLDRIFDYRATMTARLLNTEPSSAVVEFNEWRRQSVGGGQ